MSDTKLPPSLPTVVDEAGASPAWVPALGLGLFLVLALVVAAQLASRDDHEGKTKHETTAAAARDAQAPAQ
jgi:hypothetical protein